ncbi:hypothetical protein PCCS19_30280 [Paenibacillus sp. CCS19]|nr:hypothetical protein PCCS19_30280 [Paenibacillus cellulosilyticus]
MFELYCPPSLLGRTPGVSNPGTPEWAIGMTVVRLCRLRAGGRVPLQGTAFVRAILVTIYKDAISG